MANAEKKVIRITTPIGRLSFPSLFKARYSELSKKEKYEATILIPKSSDISGLVSAVKTKLEEHWPDASKRPSLAQNRGPIKDGDTWTGEDGRSKKEQYPEMGGCWVIRASSDNKPPLVDGQLLPIVEEERIYPGCWVRLGLTAFWYDNVKKGVSFGLQTVQKVKDDDPFGGRGRPEDFFETLPNDAPPAEEAPKSGKEADIFS